MERLTRRMTDGMALPKDGCHAFVRKTVDRLAHYEDLEEQGRLVELPCKVGDALYVTESRYYNGAMHTGVQCGKVYGFELDEEWVVWVRLDGDTPHSGNAYPFSDFGKTVFLSRSEAEAALAAINSVSAGEKDDSMEAAP